MVVCRFSTPASWMTSCCRFRSARAASTQALNVAAGISSRWPGRAFFQMSLTGTAP
jgi:hypothetical protein